MMKISPERNFSLNCNGRLLDLSTPKLMGILNITPDSFSDGGRFKSVSAALKHTENMLKDGAAIIDIGAQSTRPGAQFLTAQEEILRLKEILPAVRKNFPHAFLSLDTFFAETLQFGISEGVDLVNDISAGQFDENLLPLVAQSGLPYVLMHINGHYQAMHEKIDYTDITLALNRFFSEKILELQSLGIKDIVLDPGFGFGKTVEDQHQLLDECEFLGFGKFPLLIGISRKSFIYKPLGKSPLDVNEETQKLHLKVLKKGAKILRVHDVAAAQKTLSEFLNS